jgi:hypothetical protein
MQEARGISSAVGRPLSLFGADAGDTFSARNHADGCHLGTGDFLDLTGGTRAIVDLDALSEPQLADILFTRQRLRGHCRYLRKYSEGGQETESLQRGPDESFDCRWDVAIGRHRKLSVVGNVLKSIETATILKARRSEKAGSLGK